MDIKNLIEKVNNNNVNKDILLEIYQIGLMTSERFEFIIELLYNTKQFYSINIFVN